MPLIDHLRELRTRVVKSVAIISLCSIIGWFFYNELITKLSEPVCDLRAAQESGADTCGALYISGVLGPLNLQIKVSILAGIIMSAPVWLYQLWAFIAPALHRKEKRNSIFFINAVGESAADTSGTARTFDSFVDYSGFVAGDSLNISAVTNQLAGGMYVGAGLAASSNLGAFGPFTDFAGLKAALDLPAVVAAASDTGTIRTYTFSATIAGTAGNYLWIQDSQRAFTSSDLLFQTKNIGSIPVDQIALV
jgi:hypothetical protein